MFWAGAEGISWWAGMPHWGPWVEATYAQIFSNKAMGAGSCKPTVLSTIARSVGVINTCALNPHLCKASTWHHHSSNRLNCWKRHMLMLVGSNAGVAVWSTEAVAGHVLRFCLSISSAPVPHSNLPPFADSSRRVKSKYLPVSTVSTVFLVGKFGSKIGFDSGPCSKRVPCNARSRFWIRLLLPTPIQWGSVKKCCDTIMVAKAFMKKEHVGDFPALGSPVGHAHQRALQVKLVDLAAYSAISNALCWHDAKQAWNKSNAKTAGKPQPWCRYSHATARGRIVVWPRQRGIFAACSIETFKPLYVWRHCVDSDKIASNDRERMYSVYSGILSKISFAASLSALAKIANQWETSRSMARPHGLGRQQSNGHHGPGFHHQQQRKGWTREVPSPHSFLPSFLPALPSFRHLENSRRRLEFACCTIVYCAGHL